MTTLGIDDFTSNDVIDEIKHRDMSVDIIGYVDEIQSHLHLPHSKYHKLVISNGQGRRVQIVAWNDLIPTIFKRVKTCMIIHATNLAAYNPINQIYNIGNVNYELLVQDSSIITMHGQYEDEQSVIETNIGDSVHRLGLKIKIDAYVKRHFEKRKKNFERYYVGVITDGYYQLDVQMTDYIYEKKKIKYSIGQGISVTGMIQLNRKKPPRLYIDNMEDVSLLEESDLPLSQVYFANRYPRPPSINNKKGKKKRKAKNM